MSEVSVDDRCHRHPSVAATLSLLVPGLGQIYCGHFAKGFAIVVVQLFLAPLWLFALFPLVPLLQSAAIIGVFVGGVIWFWSIYDAKKSARLIGESYILKEYNRWYVYLMIFLLSLPVALAIALYCREGVVQAFVVPSRSMMPNIEPRDRVLANRLEYKSHAVKVGDVVVFVNPNNRSRTFVKRVVALPGDTVAMHDGRLRINGITLTSEFERELSSPESSVLGRICWETNGGVRYQILNKGRYDQSDQAKTNTEKPPADVASFPELSVPNGHCFVLGDNRDKSLDSRHFGPVPLADVFGRVDFKYYPKWSSLLPLSSDRD